MIIIIFIIISELLTVEIVEDQGKCELKVCLKSKVKLGLFRVTSYEYGGLSILSI